MAELARTLLGGPSLEVALPVAAERIATALELPSAALRSGEVTDQPGGRASADHDRSAWERSLSRPESTRTTSIGWRGA